MQDTGEKKVKPTADSSQSRETLWKSDKNNKKTTLQNSTWLPRYLSEKDLCPQIVTLFLNVSHSYIKQILRFCNESYHFDIKKIVWWLQNNNKSFSNQFNGWLLDFYPERFLFLHSNLEVLKGQHWKWIILLKTSSHMHEKLIFCVRVIIPCVYHLETTILEGLGLRSNVAGYG